MNVAAENIEATSESLLQKQQGLEESFSGISPTINAVSNKIDELLEQKSANSISGDTKGSGPNSSELYRSILNNRPFGLHISFLAIANSMKFHKEFNPKRMFGENEGDTLNAVYGNYISGVANALSACEPYGMKIRIFKNEEDESLVEVLDFGDLDENDMLKYIETFDNDESERDRFSQIENYFK